VTAKPTIIPLMLNNHTKIFAVCTCVQQNLADTLPSCVHTKLKQKFENPDDLK